MKRRQNSVRWNLFNCRPYFRALPTSTNSLLSFLLRLDNAGTMAIAINDVRSAYSIAVAPELSDKNDRTRLIIYPLLDGTEFARSNDSRRLRQQERRDRAASIAKFMTLKIESAYWDFHGYRAIAGRHGYLGLSAMRIKCEMDRASNFLKPPPDAVPPCALSSLGGRRSPWSKALPATTRILRLRVE